MRFPRRASVLSCPGAEPRVAGVGRSEVDENAEERVNVLLAVELIPRPGAVGDSDANSQQLLWKRGRERVLVGGVIADVNCAVARKPSARLLKRDPLVGAAAGQLSAGDACRAASVRWRGSEQWVRVFRRSRTPAVRWSARSRQAARVDLPPGWSACQTDVSSHPRTA